MGEGAVLRWPSGYRRKWIGRNIDCSLDRSLDSCDDAVGGAKGAGGGYGRNVDCSLDCCDGAVGTEECDGAVGTEEVDWAHWWAAAHDKYEPDCGSQLEVDLLVVGRSGVRARGRVRARNQWATRVRGVELVRGYTSQQTLSGYRVKSWFSGSSETK